MSTTGEKARVAADVREDALSVSVQVAASPERVYRALTSPEITAWWVRPGVFDTREWSGDVRPGGRWRAAGIANGQPYTLHGEFTVVEPPGRLAQTWHSPRPADPVTRLEYGLTPVRGGTRLELRQTGFAERAAAARVAAGWETSFERLVEILEREGGE